LRLRKLQCLRPLLQQLPLTELSAIGSFPLLICQELFSQTVNLLPTG
jgi:hypothetical protein